MLEVSPSAAKRKSDFRVERNLRAEVEDYLRKLQYLRWKEGRPYRGGGDVARGPAKGRPQHWQRGDAHDRTFVDGGRA
jgi:hypothetical protein